MLIIIQNYLSLFQENVFGSMDFSQAIYVAYCIMLTDLSTTYII